MKPSIHTKLLAFQKLGISVVKDKVNPHFKSSYCTLNEVLDKVKKPLNDMGVLIYFSPEQDGLRTTLWDVDSETCIHSFMKYVGADNAQKLLACNTYFRRGSLVSLLGLEDEDNDGNDAVKHEQKAEQKPPVREPKPFIEDAVEKIKACKSVAELTVLFNQMPTSQQATEFILEAFKKQRATFTSKSK